MAMYHEILEYQQTIKAVMKFIDQNPDTILISTSDHETGGLTVGRQVTKGYPRYEWDPEPLSRVKNSSEVLSWMWAKAIQDETDTKEYLLDTIIGQGLGLTDVSKLELARLWSWKNSRTDIEFFAIMLSDLVSRRAQIGVRTCIYIIFISAKFFF